MKILVADAIHEEGINLLRKSADVEVATGLKEAELIEKIKDADGLLVRSATKATEEVINSAKNLKVIGRAGVGVDNIDIAKIGWRTLIIILNRLL